MTQTQIIALEYLRDYTNPEVATPQFAAKVADNLEAAKERVAKP
jgi:hypothetical protein